MTIIARKDNFIASDSKFIIHRNDDVLSVYYRGEKYYLLPEKTAIVGFSGEITNNRVFDKLIEYTRAVLLRLSTGEDLNDGDPTSFDIPDRIGEVMVCTKELTLLGVIDDRPLQWVKYNPQQPVSIGSGSLFIELNWVAEQERTAMDLVEHALLYDELSGGDINYFDLNELHDIPKIEVTK